MAITLISSAGTTPSIGENTTAITTLSALGADPALLTYTIIGGADQALFALDPSTHALTFIGAPNFEAPGDADANNVYDVVVRVAIDAGTNTTQTLAITITDSNDAPVFTSANTASISENATGTLVTLAATDADAGQTLSYAISGGADAALFALDPATNALSFIAPPDFEAHADADGDNVYHVTVEASDGAGGTSTQDIAITVTNIGGVLLNGTNGGNTIDATHAGVGGGMPTGEEDIINGKAGNDVLSGLGGNDQINGDAGNDMLNGGLGADSLAGGLGNDTYIVGEALDVVTELGGTGSGTDLIRTTLTTFSLAEIANVENLAFIGTGGFEATGNGLANKLTGGAGNDHFVGGAGNDTLTGGLGDDTYVVTDTLDTIVEGTAGGTDTIETALTTLSIAAIANVENLSYTGSSDFTGVGNGFSNLLQGGEGNDQLVGGAGNDTLNGSGGFDILTGGIGNDVYVVNDLFDTIFENAAEGTDTVRTALLNFSIAALGDLENIVFTGSANAIGTGNAANNRITSGGGNDTLLGAAGNDVLSSGLGNDTLVGGAGNDVLIGGGGADNSYGGTGDDIYYVSDIGDAIIETTSATGGIDTVRTTLTSLNLAAFAGVENVVFTGSADFSATGSAIGNQLTGGTGNDTLTDSLGGIDTLSGGAGNDILSSGAANDTLLGGSGNDTLNGGTGGDILYGGDGNDILKGGAGADQIIGGAGADTIVFDTAPTTPTADRITDYSVANDQISLSMAIFTSLGGETGALDGAMFYASATGLAHDANDRIIYNTASGALAYDANGNAAGGAVVFAILTTHPASVTAAEFAVI